VTDLCGALLAGRLRRAEQMCYSTPHMRARLYISGLIGVLLALGVCSVSDSPSRRDNVLPPERAPSSSSTFRALSDFDGDGLADPVVVDPGGFPHNIEIHLSRTDKRVILPARATAGGDGSLSAQDVDGDGDTDLLWQGALPSRAVIVWLNDGVGRFECLCPPASPERELALGGPGVNASHARRPDSVLSPERNAPLGNTLTARWDFSVAATRGSHRPEHVWILFCLKRLLSTRSPPLLYC
jgi:hypothetical protein